MTCSPPQRACIRKITEPGNEKMPSNAAEQKQQINADKNTNIHNDNNYYIIYRFGTGSTEWKKKNHDIKL